MANFCLSLGKLQMLKHLSTLLYWCGYANPANQIFFHWKNFAFYSIRRCRFNLRPPLFRHNGENKNFSCEKSGGLVGVGLGLG